MPVSPEPLTGVTVAVKVTDCPEVDGLSEVLRPRLVATLLTTWFSGPVVALPEKFGSPP